MHIKYGPTALRHIPKSVIFTPIGTMAHFMKKYGWLLCTLLLLSVGAHAQDLITLTNGSTIQGKVIQITPTTVICSDINNPERTITVKKIGIATVTYANGSKTIYNLTGDTRLPEDGRKIPDNGTVHGWYFGLNAYGGVGTVTNLNDPTYTVGNTYYGGFSFLATGMIGQHFGIQFGGGADRYSYNVKYYNPSMFAGSSDLFMQRYITIPVRGIYLSNSRRRTGFFATAGMDFSFVAYATDNFSDFMTSYYNNVLLSSYGSCGVIFRNTNARGIWMLGPFIKYSMNNIYSGESLHYEGSPFVSGGNVGNFTTVGLTLSFMANFGRWEQDGY